MDADGSFRARGDRFSGDDDQPDRGSARQSGGGPVPDRLGDHGVRQPDPVRGHRVQGDY